MWIINYQRVRIMAEKLHGQLLLKIPNQGNEQDLNRDTREGGAENRGLGDIKVRLRSAKEREE